MPIPDLDEHGFLPPDVHECSLAEIRERFGQFHASDRRVRLQERLEAFVSEARGTGLLTALVVNGSFTTGTPQPEDIDIILVLREPLDLAADLRPDQDNVVSARRVKARYGFDVFAATADPQSLQPLLDFFSQVKGQPGLRKGMVRVTL